MRKLIVFNHVTLDGYFVDANGSMMWAKAEHQDKEWQDFIAENTSGNGPLIFGRVTYELMNSYWPTPLAKEQNPGVAERMNTAQKIVFSRTLSEATWNNTTLIKDDPVAEIRRLKQQSGEGMAILGSGSLVAQLAQERLIDEYQCVVNPMVLGKGRTMFEGLKEAIALKLTKGRIFRSGNVYLCYEPA